MSLDFIIGGSSLESLDISDTQVIDLTPLHNAKKLRILISKNTHISSLEPLRQLVKLEFLDISRANILDLQPLSSLNALTYIDIGRNPVREILPISRLRNISHLDISNTHISNLDPLSLLSCLEDSVRVKKIPPFDGLVFRNCKQIKDPYLQALSRKKNPFRTIETLRYLREHLMKGEEDVAGEPPPVPTQSKAPLQVGFDDGVLKALPPHAPELASADATKRAQEAYAALKEMAEAIQVNLVH